MFLLDKSNNQVLRFAMIAGGPSFSISGASYSQEAGVIYIESIDDDLLGLSWSFDTDTVIAGGLTASVGTSLPGVAPTGSAGLAAGIDWGVSLHGGYTKFQKVYGTDEAFELYNLPLGWK